MDQNKIDRIFREKAEDYQPVPSADAWKIVNGQLHPKSEGWKLYLKVAAVLVIMISAVTIIFRNEDANTSTMAISAIDYPQPIEEPIVVVPEKEAMPALTEKAGVVAPATVRVEFAEIQDPAKNRQITLLYVSRKNFEVEEFSQPAIPEIQFISPAESKIKIKYYANATPVQDEASKGKIGKLFEYAQKTSPAEMLAKAREAKDDFFSSKLNLD